MPGSSQGNAYPGHSSSDPGRASRKHPLSCGNKESSWACREREIAATEVRQNHSHARVSVAAHSGDGVPSTAAAARRRVRGPHAGGSAFAAGEITLEYACARSARAQGRKARRQWIERAGQTPAQTPMWTSRDGWIGELSGWLVTDEGVTECRRRHIKAELVMRVAVVLAAHADHATGRHCAVTNATVAQGARCSQRSVSTVRQLLSTSGLAVLIQQGHGSPTTARIGWRPAIWHLISRPSPVDNSALGDGVCDLPPSRRDRRLPPNRSLSPRARTHAPRPESHSPTRPPRPARRRCAPRPLAVQRLADELVGNVYGRAPMCHGLNHGHIGAICQALMSAGIDPAVWSAKQLANALNEDMKARRSSWPDQIERPGAFLASRLRRLPRRPEGAPGGGVTAARLDDSRGAAAQDSGGETRQTAQARLERWHADVTAVTTPEQRRSLLCAHEAKFGAVVDPFAALANAGRRAARLFPELPLAVALTRWAADMLGDDPNTVAAQHLSPVNCLSADLLVDMAIGTCDCVVCGSPDGLQRPQLPLQAMSTVCDRCWPVIATELAQASDDEEIPA